MSDYINLLYSLINISIAVIVAYSIYKIINFGSKFYGLIKRPTISSDEIEDAIQTINDSIPEIRQQITDSEELINENVLLLESTQKDEKNINTNDEQSKQMHQSSSQSLTDMINRLNEFNQSISKEMEKNTKVKIAYEHITEKSKEVLEKVKISRAKYSKFFLANDNERAQQTVQKSTFEGMEFQKIPMDGHCLFHAIGLYLGQDANFLRRIISTQMDANFDEFKPYREGSEEEFRNYIETIRSGEEWGDHIEIEIIQRITDRPVIIIRSDRNPTVPDNLESYHGDPIFIYYDGHVHYDAFILRERVEARTVLAIIQEKLAQGQTVVYAPVTQANEHSRKNLDDKEISIPGL